MQYEITAIIYDKKGRVLSIGKNSYVKTHPLQAYHAQKIGDTHRIYLHAEIHAITRCENLHQAYKMQIIRHTQDGKPANAKPCEICQSALKATSIKVIEHT